VSALQRRLTQFLDLELIHSLGAYRYARDELREVEKLLEEDRQLTGHVEGQFLIELVQIMRRYNHALDEGHEVFEDFDRHGRHPPPTELPLSRLARLDGEDLPADSTSRQSLTWVCAYYRAAIHAIGSEPAKRGDDARWQSPTARFQRALLSKRADAHRVGDGEEPEITDVQQRRRTERYVRRYSEAVASGIPHSSLSESPLTEVVQQETADVAPDAVIETIMNSHLEVDHRQPLSVFVVQVLVDAHLCMHEYEAYCSNPLSGRLSHEEGAGEQILKRSIALNTFVWTVARTAPWIFAEDEKERPYIVNSYSRAWRNNMPMVAMWNSAQISLLALHRRAYAHTLLGDAQSAYKDYHKLQRNVRATLRRLHHTSIHVDGAVEFLDGLDALADFHIGELYWADRDHTSALRHFKRAQRRMQRLKRGTRHTVINNSRWFVHLQLNLGKACYELGQHKAALGWYLRTWRSLLELIADDTSGEVHAEAIDAAVTWLDRVTDEPELHKRDVITNLAPVIEQLEAIRVANRFMSLASEVILRLGHLLYMLNLGDELGDEHEPTPAAAGTVLPEGGLAQICIRRAARLDRASTTARSDLLKLQWRAASAPDSSAKRALEKEAGSGPAVKDQWPGGAGNVEAMSRAIEYTLLQQLRFAPQAEDVDTTIARQLLHSLLTHTDSIEARKSQVHDYLTRKPASDEMPRADDAPALEFVCLRRYSSAYPILPRPHEFRSHGGGYFVRCHPGGKGRETLGIAVDPGTSYVECLYRAGFGLADIDVVIVTHDHVDHASSFEPLLALRFEMRQLNANRKPLLVLGNRSVIQRWKKIATYHTDDVQGAGPRPDRGRRAPHDEAQRPSLGPRPARPCSDALRDRPVERVLQRARPPGSRGQPRVRRPADPRPGRRVPDADAHERPTVDLRRPCLAQAVVEGARGRRRRLPRVEHPDERAATNRAADEHLDVRRSRPGAA
jgi:hypothetical protein